MRHDVVVIGAGVSASRGRTTWQPPGVGGGSIVNQAMMDAWFSDSPVRLESYTQKLAHRKR